MADSTNRDAQSRNQKADSATKLTRDAHSQPQDQPTKWHGDALQDGSGNRHGVEETDQRPKTGE